MSIDQALIKVLESTATDLSHLLKIIPASYLFRSEIIYDMSNNPIYVGIALSNSSLSDPKWMIKKIVYDGNNNPLRVIFADGEIKFNKVMSSYSGYTYSES